MDMYHPACVGMTIEEAKKLDHFVCSECSSDDDMKKPQATFPVSPGSDGKAIVFLVTMVGWEKYFPLFLSTGTGLDIANTHVE
ncbi:hypothetical protein Ahy_B08g092440 isoform B [Arachis hypogaea]|uniref:Uncharacterized protein n=1 Tax=Arachis hypogaea TaxID=3818 RepID=A0A444Y3Y1_ARAHY|nr:hypothetical protein Ahy_B08g092440 isoform B [Arachis hypogaea]